MTWKIGAEPSGPGEIIIVEDKDGELTERAMAVKEAIAFIGSIAAAVQGAMTIHAPGFERGRQPGEGT